MSAAALVGLNLPVTGTFLVPLTAYYAFLQNRVVFHRITKNKPNGDPPEADTSFSSASRSQINFIENVPIAVLLAAVAELNGGNKKTLTGFLSALFLFRVAHAELGLMLKGALGLGRPVGYFGTQGVIVGLAGYAAYLVKSYWGY